MKALQHLILLWHIGRQMGWHYVLFRAGYWLQAKAGILKLRFPRKASGQSFVSVAEWIEYKPKFLFDLQNINLQRNPKLTDLKWRARQIRSGRFCYFSNQWFEVPDWHTNPLTGHCYPTNEHWSDVNDFSAAAGDIKYVWEKSRFTFLYDLIRYDYHFSEDQSAIALGLIADWIDHNPVNCGPNWKCGQEIALRVLNWTFALHYYRASPALNQSLLDKILCSIYDQMRHIAGNIRFSEVAVRNNHVLTEALGLFVTGLMFPCFPESDKWKLRGKSLFEREISSQIVSDGTYLQFSMNYHRVVVQLLIWGIRLAELNADRMRENVYSRARASLAFLSVCQNDVNGQLPNYGNNDGALFFPLSECDFRDYRPQLNALAAILGDCRTSTAIADEETAWLGIKASSSINHVAEVVADDVYSFARGGYYVIRDAGTLTFLRCGNYYSRPFQADHNHLDIWVNGRNILRDAGTWLYNADEESMRYFSGTESHNTVMIDNFDQMQKQSRFVWTHWVRNAKGATGINADGFWVEAEFEGFRHIGEGIVHRRRVAKKRGQLLWTIEDQVLNVPKGMRIRQLWHPVEAFRENFDIGATNENGRNIEMVTEQGWYSEYYGSKVETDVLVFETIGNYLRTIIKGHK